MRIVYFIVLAICIPMYALVPVYLLRNTTWEYNPEEKETIYERDANKQVDKLFMAFSIFWLTLNSCVFWTLLY